MKSLYDDGGHIKPEALADIIDEARDLDDDEPEQPCWACHKVNCSCDEDTMQAIDNQQRESEEQNA